MISTLKASSFEIVIQLSHETLISKMRKFIFIICLESYFKLHVDYDCCLDI